MINIDATRVHIVLNTLTPQEGEVGGMFNTTRAFTLCTMFMFDKALLPSP